MLEFGCKELGFHICVVTIRIWVWILSVRTQSVV